MSPRERPEFPDGVPVETARSLGLAALAHVEADPEHASVQIEHLLAADLQGRASHGMQRLPVLVQRILNGLIDPRATPAIERSGSGLLRVDGNEGFGPVVMAAVIGELIGRREVGVAAIRRAGHIGILTPYLERLARAGFVSLVFTTSEALVHPAGGSVALVGTNPVGIGVPTSGDPLLIDLATAAMSAGEIIAHAERGEPLPPDRAVGPDGRPTTDPQLARAGAISPFGGAKGFALGLGIELLVAALTSTALGTDVRGTLDTVHPVTKGDVVLALPLESTGSELAALEHYLTALRESPPAPGHDAVRLPGDRARAERARRIHDGIPYPPATWTALTSLVEKAGWSP
jgi:L-2-hydroxycarboxylate dehydrogenase (NAD+)